MSRARVELAACAIALVLSACTPESRDAAVRDKLPDRFGIGRAATPAELAASDVDVGPDGAGLPAGSGTPEQGAPVFLTNCATCHGNDGEGKPPLYPQIIGGPRGSFDFASDAKIPRTIGNYWPYATTVFDYIRRAMPLTAPGSLTSDQTYAVTAYLLNREGLLAAGATLDARSLPAIQMPARSHFVPDDRRGSTGGAKVR